MNKPTSPGYYWAYFDKHTGWEVVYVDGDDFYPITRIGEDCCYQIEEVQEWGEKIER